MNEGMNDLSGMTLASLSDEQTQTPGEHGHGQTQSSEGSGAGLAPNPWALTIWLARCPGRARHPSSPPSEKGGSLSASPRWRRG